MKSIKISIIPMLAAAFTACSDAAVYDFVAPVTEVATTSAKSTFDNRGAVEWMPGDAISVFKQTASDTEPIKFTSLIKIDEPTNENSSFSGNAFENANGLYYAIYPHRNSNKADYENGKIIFNYPQVQKVNLENDYATGVNPAVASSNQLGGFEFSSLFGALRLELAGDGVIKTIDVTTTDEKDILWGDIIVDMQTKQIESIVNSDEKKRVITLDCGDGIAISSSPKYFMLAIPPTVQNGKLSVTLNFADGSTLTLNEIEKQVVKAVVEQNELVYLDGANQVLSVAIEDVIADTFTPKATDNVWVVTSDTEPTLDAIQKVVQKASQYATTSAREEISVAFVYIEQLKAASVVSGTSDARNVKLLFPRLKAIEAGVMSSFEGLVSTLEVSGEYPIDVAQGAFDGFQSENCKLFLNSSVNPFTHNMDTYLNWKDKQWKEINGVRTYHLTEFDSAGLLANGTSPAGDIWWVDMQGAVGSPEGTGNTATHGLRAAVSKSSTPVSLRMVGTPDGNGQKLFHKFTNLKEIDLSTLSIIPERVLSNSSIERLILNKNITLIQPMAVELSRSLTEVVFVGDDPIRPAMIIDNLAFAYCSKLKAFDMPWAKEVRNRVFHECRAMQKANLSGATKFGAWVFPYCASLIELNLSATGNFEFLDTDKDNPNDHGQSMFKDFVAYAKICTLYLNTDKFDGSSSPAPTDRYWLQNKTELIWRQGEKRGK